MTKSLTPMSVSIPLPRGGDLYRRRVVRKIFGFYPAPAWERRIKPLYNQSPSVFYPAPAWGATNTIPIFRLLYSVSIPLPRGSDWHTESSFRQFLCFYPAPAWGATGTQNHPFDSFYVSIPLPRGERLIGNSPYETPFLVSIRSRVGATTGRRIVIGYDVSIPLPRGERRRCTVRLR